MIYGSGRGHYQVGGGGRTPFAWGEERERAARTLTLDGLRGEEKRRKAVEAASEGERGILCHIL